MRLKLKILSDLEKRLKAVTTPAKGQIHAVIYDKTCLVVGVNFFSDTITCWKDTKLRGCHHHYPAGVDLCGLVFIHESDNVPNLEIETASELKHVIVTDNPLVITKDLSSDSLKLKILRDGILTDRDYEIMTADQFDKEFFFVCVKSEVQLSMATTLHETIRTFENAKQMTGIETGIFFNVLGSKMQINDNQDSGKLVDLYVDNSMDPRLNKGVLEVTSLFPLTGSNAENVQVHAPDFLVSSRDEPEEGLIIHLEGLCVTHVTRELNDTYGLFIESICRSLHLARSVIIRVFPRLRNMTKDLIMRFFHFCPTSLGHPLTMCLLDSLPEAIRKTLIEELHDSLYLPKHEGPVFTKGSAISFDASLKGLILNVHERVRKSKVVDGKVSLVKGVYSYYHYLQNDYDDCGWGCAYRSLQTIFSWFRLQGYTDKKVPTHREIQQCLVLIGDKPKSFIGSKNWIGSNEIAFCLQTMLDIDCRILTKGSGQELATIGPELDAHFESQGTPVMIGGGQLAHTILGVDYNEETGSINFLVLDPHYTGKDVIKDITSRGVGWKGLDFWSKTSFYNLCLPLKKRSAFY